MIPVPPRRAERLVRWSLAPWERPALLGDLNEEFRDILERSGARQACRWYWYQVLFSIWPNLIRRLMGDEYRYQRARWAAWQIGLWGFLFLLDVLGGRPFRVAIVWLCGALLALTDSIFSKRPIRPRPIKTREQGALILASLALLFGVLYYGLRRGLIDDRQVTIFFVAVQVGAFLWRRRIRDDGSVFDVRHKLTPDLEREALLTVSVPNEPFALSRLILRRMPDRDTPLDDPYPLHTYDPIIRREFTPDQPIRAFTIVNLPDSGESVAARVELVDSAGAVVKRVVAPVVAGHLVQVGPWDKFADEDPAEHFGQIDATVPLSGLAPGEYTLRVSVGDGVARSSDDEVISIASS